MARLRIPPARERDATPGAAALPPVTRSPPRHRPGPARRATPWPSQAGPWPWP